jgi:Cu2+-exporting ATPase
VHEVPGKGLECTVGGTTYRLGSAHWAAASTARGSDPWFCKDGTALAVIETVEVSRRDAVAEVGALADEGYELWIASGDSASHVRALAKSLKIPRRRAWGNLSPEGKRDLVAHSGRADTLMIGDGINDSLALSSALCSGTPAVDRPFVPARTDFYFLTAGLGPIRLALHVAKAMRRVVINALVFATLYNVFAVGLAYAGLMRPWLAAVLMPASSILVLTYTSLALSPRRTLWKS